MVTGASGFIGRHLLHYLRKNGSDVLPVYRSLNHCKDGGILFKDVSANAIMAKGFGAACIVHLVGPTQDDDINEALVHTTEVMCTVGREISARRIVYISGFGINPRSTNLYFRSKTRAEEAIQQSGFPFTIFRCSYICGEGDEFTPTLLNNLIRGYVEIPGDGRYRIQPVYVGDVAAVIRNAGEQRSNDCQLINLLGEPIRYIDFVSALAKRVSPNANIYPQPVEKFMRAAVLDDEPHFSLTELAILLLDLVGGQTGQCFDVTMKGQKELLDILTGQAV